MTTRKNKPSAKISKTKDFSITEPSPEEIKKISDESQEADERVETNKGKAIKSKISRRKTESKKRNVPVPARLAQKLKQIRVDHDLTQAKMLRIVNPEYSEDNRARLSAYEKGTRVPSLVELWNYAKFAGIPMEILVDDTANLPKPKR